jgi:LysM repeat protein
LYYFQVRGGNGCATGNWSGINSVATLGGSQNADTISNIVQSVFPEKTLKIVSSKLTSQKSKACSYTVESGDSLWSIASSHLGHGADYIILKALNDSTTGLHVGQVLQLPCDNKPQTIAKAVEEIKQLGVSLAVKVLNTENQPVSGATVTLHSKVQIAKTDIHGIAKFSDVEKGKHKVLITYDGYTGSENLHIDGKKKKQTLTMKVQLQGFSSIFVMTILSILGIIIVVLLTVVFLLFKKMKKQQK